VISGETGAAGLALLQASQAMPHLAQALGLDAHSRVLIIGSEGNTDPEIYRAIIHQPPQPRTDYLLEQLHALAQIGLQDDGACSRLALTDQDRMGRDWLVDVMKSLDLNVHIDQIGNLFGIFEGAEPELDPIMTGSHIDTVRTVGRDDGCLGVLAGLEIIRCMQAAGIKPRRSLVVCAFTNDEGARYGPDMLGSLVFAQAMALEQALRVVGVDGSLLGEELARIGYAGPCKPGHIKAKAFIELHMAHGPILEQAGCQIGVVEGVEGVEGISWQGLEIVGQSNHAGTTPIPVAFDLDLINSIERLAQAHRLTYQRIIYGAGHDAQILARVCPTAMIVISSARGLSHNPADYSHAEAIDAGLQLLYALLRELCEVD
jgi:N-carbamoyl-L-amino-acid hydrolase